MDYYNKIDFVYLDIDDPANNSFKNELGFRYQPHLLLLDGDGQILYQWIGPQTRDEFVSVFEDILSQ